MDNTYFLFRLIEVLRLLGSNFDTQRELMPTGVNLTDEIALLFDDIWQKCDFLLMNNMINNLQMEKIKKINRMLDILDEDQEMWDESALKTKDEWETIRKLSMDALKAFGKEYATPNINWIQFVWQEGTKENEKDK